MPGDETKFYFDFHYPLKIVQYILDQIFGRKREGPRRSGGPGVVQPTTTLQ